MPYVDVKVTVWERYYYKKGSDISKIVEVAKDEVSLLSDPDIGFSETEFMIDTSEFMLPNENMNQSTIEVYDDNGDLFWDNEPVETKRENNINKIIE